MRTLQAVRLILAVALAGVASLVSAQSVSPHAIDIPSWFVESFLDFREDVADAKRDGKRVMIYVGQDGCPYCAKLMQVNFKQKDIVDYTRKHFVPIALNLWGDRETVWIDGRAMPEKELARALNVQFTPTLLFLDEQGAIIARINGYYPPHRFKAALEYAAQHLERKTSLADHLQRAEKDASLPGAKLNDQSFFMQPPYDLRRKRGDKPLAVLFESGSCTACDEMHRDGFSKSEVRQLVGRLDIARFALNDRNPIVTPDGRKLAVDEWIREQQITYTPTIQFFDDRGTNVFRVEAYIGPFHLASALDYVTSGAYRTEPSFQRFIQVRADRIRAQGGRVELH